MVVQEMALFLDYENIHIGMETTFGAAPDVRVLVRAIQDHFSRYGSIIIGKAYGDWERFMGVPAAFQREQVEPVYIGAKRLFPSDATVRPGVAKNAADIQLALDAQELLFSRPNISNYILVSGDYDFVPLVIRLHQHSKRVCVCGIEKRTSRDLRDLAGDDFVSVDELLGLRALNVPKLATVDWYAFVSYLDRRERGSMPFIGRKLFARELPSAVVGRFDTKEGRENVVGEAVVAGMVDLYYVPNPRVAGTQTAAVRLNRDHEFVKSTLSSQTAAGEGSRESP
ncbi:MAG: NYN domain-containing protein [Chloroflexota bacterium]|nr:NYN domain-containing protein [Chloroflexota bacterium]